MAYRLAKSLETLRANVNSVAPVRNRASDGWIGDAAHASRSSDHNPWVKDGKLGVVTALDITHDPAHGVDGGKLAEILTQDPRVKYIIWNRKIWNSSVAKVWRAYKGKNPHTKHVHVSVKPQRTVYDDVKPWTILPVPPVLLPEVPPPSEVITEVPPPKAIEPVRAVLKLGSQGGDVFELQRRLGVTVDGDFGPKTQVAVKALQKANKLVVDGVVGPYTWAALEEKTAAAPPVDTSETLISTPPPPADAKWVIGKLRELGYSRLDAIAYAANLVWESGGKGDGIVWNARGDKGRDGLYHSHGAAQWNDKHGRYEDLLKFAEKRGKLWTDPETQVLNLDRELKGSETAARTRVETAQTLADKMKAAITFWRPSIPHADKRLKIAEKLEKETPDA